MVAAADVYLPIAAPPVVRRDFGLYSVVPPQTPLDGHWMGGASWENLLCGEDFTYTYDDCIAGGSAEPALAMSEDCPPIVTSDAFTLYYWAKHSGPASPSEAARRVRAMFEGAEEWAVEKRWYTQLAAGGTTNLAAAVPLIALAALEDAIGGVYPGAGVIHMSRGNAVRLAQYLVTVGTRKYTAAGTPVVVGGGYSDSSILNDLVGTGSMALYRSDLDIPGEDSVFFDRVVNDANLIGQRTFLVQTDCTVFRQPVTIT